MSRRYLVVSVCLVFAAVTGCSGSGTPGDDSGNDSVAVDVLTDGGQDNGQNPDVRDVIPDTERDLFDASVEDTGDPCAAKPYGFGCICEENRDCADNFCILSPGENVYRCTRTCYDDCPTGWKCQEVSVGGSDTNYICRPVYEPLCDRECIKDSDCQSAGAMCVQNGTKKYCAKACTVDSDCSPKTRVKECNAQEVCTFDTSLTADECETTDFCELVQLQFQCVEVQSAGGGGTAKQCISTSGHCECGFDTDYQTDSNHCGDCETVCSMANANSFCEGGECKFGGCLTGFVDLDNDRKDCEYECLYQVPEDFPDAGYVDANCDGIDGDPDLAIFVKEGGDDEDLRGDMAHPFATINAAIAFAAQHPEKHQVYVSKGLYKEEVTLVNGVSVYGGYDAENGWKRNLTTNITTIQGIRQELLGIRSVVAKDISDPTVFDGFTVETPDASSISGSSYGIHVVNSDDSLTISNCIIRAGRGMSGRFGSNGGGGANGNNGTKGSDAFVHDACGICFTCKKYDYNTYMIPGPGGTSPCGENGGAGGKGGKYGYGGTGGSAGTNGGGAGGPGAPSDTDDGSPGLAGVDGADGNNGAGGLSSGSVSGAGMWVPLNGGDGTDGYAGKGGGGGGGGGGDDDNAIFEIECYSTGGAGGGGGAGGCPGKAGTAGTGAGGSFGLFLVQSSPKVINNVIRSGLGGNGGMGGQGGTGGTGGASGAGGSATSDTAGAGAAGGKGGDGGNGGHGGGGPGGPSYALYISGNASNPTCSGNTLEPGSGGDGGFSGDPSSTSNKGQTGGSGKIFGVTGNCQIQ